MYDDYNTEATVAVDNRVEVMREFADLSDAISRVERDQDERDKELSLLRKKREQARSKVLDIVSPSEKPSFFTSTSNYPTEA